MAAARGDQVAETASSRQPGASIWPGSDAAPSATIVTHTPAPERPPDSDPQGSAEEASCSQPGSGLPDSMGRSATEAASNGLTASTGSLTGSGAQFQAVDSAPTAEETDGQAFRQEDEEGSAGPATSQGNLDTSWEPSQDHDTSTDQLLTDPLEGPPYGGLGSGGVAVNMGEGRGQRPARTPLAAVQEAVAPMLGSLSFKQTMQGKQSHGKCSP